MAKIRAKNVLSLVRSLFLLSVWLLGREGKVVPHPDITKSIEKSNIQDQELTEVYHANDVDIRYACMLVSSYTTLCMHKCMIHM